MQANQWTLTLNGNVYKQFQRIKNQGDYLEDQDVLRDAFAALDREWQHGSIHHPHFENERYMKHPGLSLDDYDT